MEVVFLRCNDDDDDDDDNNNNNNIIITFLTSQQFSWFSEESRFTDQVLFIHCSAKNFLTIGYVVIITALCIIMYTAGRLFSNFQRSCNLFGIILVVDNTSGIM